MLEAERPLPIRAYLAGGWPHRVGLAGTWGALRFFLFGCHGGQESDQPGQRFRAFWRGDNLELVSPADIQDFCTRDWRLIERFKSACWVEQKAAASPSAAIEQAGPMSM
jgi:hypothetical protein